MASQSHTPLHLEQVSNQLNSSTKAFKFINTIKTTEQIPFKTDHIEVAQALEKHHYNLQKIQGINIHGAGQRIEITTPDQKIREKIVTEGLVMQGLTIIFEPSYNNEQTIKFFNVPAEYQGTALRQLIETAGGVITKEEIINKKYKEFEFYSGERHYTLDRSQSNFTGLPLKIRLFGGRIIGIRYPGQEKTAEVDLTKNSSWPAQHQNSQQQQTQQTPSNENSNPNQPRDNTNFPLPNPQSQSQLNDEYIKQKQAAVQTVHDIVRNTQLPSSSTTEQEKTPSSNDANITPNPQQTPPPPAPSAPKTEISNPSENTTISCALLANLLPQEPAPENQNQTMKDLKRGRDKNQLSDNEAKKKPALGNTQSESVLMISQGDEEHMVRYGNLCHDLRVSSYENIEKKIDQADQKKSLSNAEIFCHYHHRQFRRDPRLDGKLDPQKFSKLIGYFLFTTVGSYLDPCVSDVINGLTHIQTTRRWSEIEKLQSENHTKFITKTGERNTELNNLRNYQYQKTPDKYKQKHN